MLDGRYRNKLQYSTPGVAGDGTAVLIKAVHDFGGKEQALDCLGKLQANNVCPSASTGKPAPKVDKGELLVANRDVQMNFAQATSMPNLGIWFPQAKGGKPTTFSRCPRTWAPTSRPGSQPRTADGLPGQVRCPRFPGVTRGTAPAYDSPRPPLLHCCGFHPRSHAVVPASGKADTPCSD